MIVLIEQKRSFDANRKGFLFNNFKNLFYIQSISDFFPIDYNIYPD